MNREINETNIPIQLENYQLHGFCVIKGLLKDEEIKIFQDESLKLWTEQKDLNAYNLRIGIRKDPNGNDRLERLDPVIDISEIFSKLNDDKRIVQLAEDALKGPVTVLKEKLIYKWPGVCGYGAHRDEPYFKVPYNAPSGLKMLTVSIALDKADVDNGAIKFYPDLRFEVLSSPIDEPKDIDPVELKGKPYVMPKLNPGDIVLFDGIIPHASDLNQSEYSRRTYMITFIPQQYEGYREKYYNHRFQSLIGERKNDYDGVFHVK